MLPKRTHLWECKLNEETSLYEHSNGSMRLTHLMAKCIGTWWNEQWNNEMNNEIMKWTMKWWNPRRVK